MNSPHDSLLEQLSAVLRALPAEACAAPMTRDVLLRIRHNLAEARARAHHPLAPELLREALDWAQALTSTTNSQSGAQRGADDAG